VGTTWHLLQSRNSALRGDSNFDDLSVRSRYGPPDCSLPGLIRTRNILARLELLFPGFQPPGSPQRLPDITTVPNWELHRRDSHPLAKQLASLRHFLAVYASLLSITRQRQDSLSARPLRLWPDWIFTSWILSKGFIRSPESSSPKLCLARYPSYPQTKLIENWTSLRWPRGFVLESALPARRVGQRWRAIRAPASGEYTDGQGKDFGRRCWSNGEFNQSGG